MGGFSAVINVKKILELMVENLERGEKTQILLQRCFLYTVRLPSLAKRGCEVAVTHSR
jgi:hypothetical protein